MVGLIAYIILLAPHSDTVTATTYRLTAKENGPYGNKMASGYKVSYKAPEEDRVIAISRDLVKHFPFHSYVTIENAGALNGVWKVEDVMNKRFKNRIDFLIGYKAKTTKLHNVIIHHYEYKSKSHIRHRNRRNVTIHRLRTKQHHNKVQRAGTESTKAGQRSKLKNRQSTRRAISSTNSRSKIRNNVRVIKRKKSQSRKRVQVPSRKRNRIKSYNYGDHKKRTRKANRTQSTGV